MGVWNRCYMDPHEHCRDRVITHTWPKPSGFHHAAQQCQTAKQLRPQGGSVWVT